ncbi:MAG: hypothetical protein ACN6RG_08880 [Stenotrophomonas sp.]
MKPRSQLQQTILSTGVVGALFSAVRVLFLLASLLTDPPTGMPPRVLVQQAMELALLFCAGVVLCITLFGLLPMAIVHAGVWLMRRWTD